MTTVVEEVGTVQLGIGSYQLVRTKSTPSAVPTPAWAIDMIDEPPWEGGLQPLLSLVDETWHLGGLRSTYTPGHTEHGINTDCRWAGRVVPGPKIYSIALPGATSGPHWFFEALGQLFICAGSNVYRINPGTDICTLSKAFSTEGNPVMGVGWEGNKGYVGMHGGDARLMRVSALGSPDTWTQSADTTAFRLAVGANRLYKITTDGELRNILSGLDPMNNSAWADRVQVGVDESLADANRTPHSLVAYGRSVIVGKPDGIFGIDDEGRAFSLMKRIMLDVLTGIGIESIEPYVYMPHMRGLYRYQPGYSESVGLEKELDNSSPVKGRFTSFASDGNYTYAQLQEHSLTASATQIMVGKEQAEGFGPISWDTLFTVPNLVNIGAKIHISALWDPPRLFFSNLLSASYTILPKYGGGPDVDESSYRFNNVTSGNRTTGKYNFGTWLDKDFPKVQIACKGVSVLNEWRLLFSVDGGAFSANDISGSLMNITSEGIKTFYLPRTARGREIQFKFQYVISNDNVKIEIVYFEPFAIPISKTVPIVSAMLRLAEGTHYDFGIEGRSTIDQLNDLVALSEDSTPIAMNGPWGDWVGHIKSIRVQEVIQEGMQEPEYLVAVSLQRREEASGYA